MFRKLLNRFGCALVGHDWGFWYKFNWNGNFQYRECKCCNKKIIRAEIIDA